MPQDSCSNGSGTMLPFDPFTRRIIREFSENLEFVTYSEYFAIRLKSIFNYIFLKRTNNIATLKNIQRLSIFMSYQLNDIMLYMRY